MPYKLPLTKANRLRLAEAFRHTPRVDNAIDCVIEGQLVQAFVDDPEWPSAWGISIGPLSYYYKAQ